VLIVLISITAIIVPLQAGFDYGWWARRDVYLWLWFFVMLQSIFSCATVSLCDAVVLVHLENDKLLYGKQRL